MHTKIIFGYILFFISILCFTIILTKPLLGDEIPHYLIISDIVRGTISDQTFNRAAVLPGYFFLIAGIDKTIGLPFFSAYRATSFLLSIFSVVAFFWVAEILKVKNVGLRTLQYFFLPLLFPFFFLLYTDAASVLIVLLSFSFLLLRKYNVAGLLGLFSVLVRQDNVLWLFFFFSYVLIDQFGLKISWTALLSVARKLWLLILSIMIVGTIGIFSGGPTLAGQARYHPLSMHFGNIFLLFIILFILFMPLHFVNIKKIFLLLKKQPSLIVILLTIYFLFVIFVRVDHPWNITTKSHYWRNDLINFMFKNFLNKTLFFFPAGFVILSLCVTKLRKKAYYMLYPISLILLSLHWLIESRYLILPVVFFLLFRTYESRNVERQILSIMICYSAVIFLFIIGFSSLP